MAVRIAFVGDSITLGTGDPRMLGWPGRVCAAARNRGHDVTCYNLGVRGDTTQEIRSRWLEESKRRLPEEFDCRLVFAFGLNDCVLQDGATLRVEPNRTWENAAAILDKARAWLPTVLIGPAPVDDSREPPQLTGGKQLRIFNRQIEMASRLIQSAADQRKIPYLDLFTPLVSDTEWRRLMQQGDGVHPTDAGYERLATIVDSWTPWQRLLVSRSDVA